MGEIDNRMLELSKAVLDGAINAIDNKDYYILEVLTPGHDKIDVVVDVGEIELRPLNTQFIVADNYLTKQFMINDLHKRRILIPDDVDLSKIESSTKNGILTIKLNKLKQND